MIFILTLIFAALIQFWLTYALWKKTRDVGFLIGSFFLYYWSLHGAWFISINKTFSTEIAPWYFYLEDKLFPVYLDANYYFSIILYSIFIYAILLVALFFTRGKTAEDFPNNHSICISHSRLIFIAFFSLIASFLCVKGDVFEAIQSNASIYLTTRLSPNPLFTLHILLNFTLSTSLAIGIATYISNKKAIFIKSLEKRFVLLAYVLLSIVAYAYLMFLGNKNELLFAIIICILIFFKNAGFSHMRQLSILTFSGVCSVLLLAAVELIRRFGIYDLIRHLNLQEISWVLQQIFIHAEAFSPHFSLYGTLSYAIPLSYGSSFLTLASSIIPRFLFPNRPLEVYYLYADSVFAIQDQGYTIHQATGWFLNFGVPGVLIAGIFLGCLWAYFYNKSQTEWSSLSSSELKKVYLILSPIFFVAILPNILRGGIENYKGVALQGFILPFLIFFVSTKWYYLNGEKSFVMSLKESQDQKEVIDS